VAFTRLLHGPFLTSYFRKETSDLVMEVVMAAGPTSRSHVVLIILLLLSLIHLPWDWHGDGSVQWILYPAHGGSQLNLWSISSLCCDIFIKYYFQLWLTVAHASSDCATRNVIGALSTARYGVLPNEQPI
jgi:hypothetical protein